MSVNEETSSTLKELSDKNPDGTRLGQDATDLIAFFGADPIVQPTDTDQASVTTADITSVTTVASTTSTPYGYSTQAQADAIVTAVNDVITRLALVNKQSEALRTALVDLGLIKGS